MVATYRGIMRHQLATHNGCYVSTHRTPVPSFVGSQIGLPSFVQSVLGFILIFFSYNT